MYKPEEKPKETKKTKVNKPQWYTIIRELKKDLGKDWLMVWVTVYRDLRLQLERVWSRFLCAKSFILIYKIEKIKRPTEVSLIKF